MEQRRPVPNTCWNARNGDGVGEGVVDRCQTKEHQSNTDCCELHLHTHNNNKQIKTEICILSTCINCNILAEVISVPSDVH